MINPAVIVASVFLAILNLTASPAAAHAFGQRYDLPLPLWLYTTGAGATVLLSFAVIALFLRRTHGNPEKHSFDLLSVSGLRWLGHRWLLIVAQAAAVGVFVLILAACFFGNPASFENIAPTFVWVVWWVGLAFWSALIGNVWDLLNPWRILYRWGVRLCGVSPVPRVYPEGLGHWPAVILFFVFAWMELISESAEKPRTLGVLIVLYSLTTWSGMARYGEETWRRHGEVFSVVFGILARFAPLRGNIGELRLRFPAMGLLVRNPLPMSYVCFVLLLLTSVTFDGILETPHWQSTVAWISESMALRGMLVFLQRAGLDLLIVIKTLALVLMPLIFIGAYLAVSRLIGLAGFGRVSVRHVAGYFVLSLVPIAIAYHLSHYLSYLLIAGQNIVPLVSDPFGVGWDLFDTRTYRLDFGIVNAKFVWYVAVTAIVVRHDMSDVKSDHMAHHDRADVGLVAIVQDDDLNCGPGLKNGTQLLDIHLKSTISNESNNFSFRCGEFCTHCRWKTKAHGA